MAGSLRSKDLPASDLHIEKPPQTQGPSSTATATGSGAEIVARFRTLVTACTLGSLDERAFVQMLLQLDSDYARAHGFVITASNTDDDWTVIALRKRGRSEPCAAFEFLPGTGLSRELGSMLTQAA